MAESLGRRAGLAIQGIKSGDLLRKHLRVLPKAVNDSLPARAPPAVAQVAQEGKARAEGGFANGALPARGDIGALWAALPVLNSPMLRVLL